MDGEADIPDTEGEDMNKLEEYRDKLAKESTGFIPMEQEDRELVNARSFYKSGFDAAITLELPVKFTEWMVLNGIKQDGIKNGEVKWMKWVNQGTTKELYQYWIDNIYKPE